MKKIEIEYIKPSDLKPYENNPRFNEDAVDYVAESIRKFGFKVPIVIDKNNVIIAGHTRLLASEMLGLKEIPCIRAKDLTKDQVNAFRIADNKVSEFSTWDVGKLEIELGNIQMDMSGFGFLDEDFEVEIPDDDEVGWYGEERIRTDKAYNLTLVDHSNLTNDFWQMPIIRRENYIPDDLIGFNYAKTSKNKECGIHFYIDDYQFERIWNYPEKYLNILSEYDCMLSPDFSLYMDMPMPMKIWNVYRSRFIGSYYQNRGIKVIPTISWAEPETYEFCFLGIPEGSVVSISTVGVKESQDALKVWHDGVDAMIEAINPSAILIYGGEIDHDYSGIPTYYYKNKVTEEWKNRNNNEKDQEV